MINNKEWLFDGIAKHEGENFTITVELHGKEATPIQRVYFRKVIVGEMQKAFEKGGERFTKERTEQIILSFCPDAIDERHENGKWQKYVLQFEALTSKQASKVIDTIKQIAAENYGHYIP